MIEDVDLIVVGAGQAGPSLAHAFAGRGRRVVLIERDRVGGTCVNYGCTPSKAYLASAHWAGRARQGEPLHVRADVSVDVPGVMDRVRSVRDEWHSGSLKKLEGSTVELVMAEGSFTGERIVDAGGASYRAPIVVLDTGSSPAVPQIDGLAGTPYLTNLNWFDQVELPKRLVVIGGGYIGAELGQGAQRLGSAVTIVGNATRLMEREDEDATAILEAALRADGVALRLGVKTTTVAHRGGLFTITLDDGSVLEAEGLLVATGRTPNSAALQADRSGIALDERGYVVTDEHLQTTCPGVYAVGEIANQPAFTHVVWEDYRRLLSTLDGTPRRKDDRILAYTTFTEPQLARAGMSEAQAREAGIDARSVTSPLSDNARGAEWHLETGFYRFTIDAKTEKLIGATMIGYEAGEIVHTVAFAIQQGCTWRDLDAFVGIHPTFGEGLPSVARLFA